MYNTRYLTVFFILFFILTSLLSCNINKQTSILWKATSPKSTSPLYILGTNHDESISAENEGTFRDGPDGEGTYVDGEIKYYKPKN